MRRQDFRLVMAPRQRSEIEGVLTRPKFVQTYHVARRYLDELLYVIDTDAEIVDADTRPPVSVRDPKDEAILVAAIAGHADYLVTGDADLLVLADEPALLPLRIVTIRQMLDVLEQFNTASTS